MKREVEDWLTELPPLDGDDDDLAVDVDTADDIEPAVEHDSLDDAAAENLDLEGDGVEEDDGERVNEADDQWSADVGEPELDLPADEAADDDDAEAHGVGVGADDMEVEEPSSADDGGEDGTNDPVEQSLDEELPALDADDEGDFEDALVADALVAFGDGDGDGDRDRDGGSDARSSSRRADVMWREQAGSSRPLTWTDDEDPCLDVSSRGADAIVAVSAMGNVWARAGERMRLTSHAELQAAAGGALDGPLAVSMEPSSDVVWLVDRVGRVLRSADGGFTWSKHGHASAPPLAVVAREGSLTVLLHDLGGARLLTSQDGSAWFEQRLSLQLQTIGTESRCWVALSLAAVAVGDAGGVWLARDGQRFQRVPRSRGAVAGVFTGSRADAALVFARPADDGEGGTHLVRVDDVGGVEVVAHLGPREAPGHDADEIFPVHLHWDDELHTMQVAYASAIVACGAPPASPQAARR